MVWLLHNYFIPTINPSSIPASQSPLRPVAPILKQYKNLLKITTKDTSLGPQYKQAVLSIMKHTERWISEAKVAANVAAGEVGWEASAYEYGMDSDYIEVREKWALERLCDALLEKGALVPLSKKFVLPVFRDGLSHISLENEISRRTHFIHQNFLSNYGLPFYDTYRLSTRAFLLYSQVRS